MVRRGKNRSRRQTRRPRILRTLAIREHGHKLRGRSDPPEYTLCPWWPVTVAMTSTDDTSFTPKSIYGQLLAQVSGIGAPTGGQLRISSIRCWNLSENNPVRMTVLDFHRNGPKDKASNHVLASIVDFPGKISYSHIGWQYGLEHSKASFGLDDDKTIIANISGKTVLVYINVLIRFTASNPKSLTDAFDMLEDALNPVHITQRAGAYTQANETVAMHIA